ncbi:hypothetical protein [Halocatena pleomorpha]|uniref:Uncharacterized protein n=1 Tax=Halocatena pleomorpha TaxID=1785090 RepID=A0A3P3R575_9EURY|nr:hypothetical protein [Halocatena pleomorpha]RRJ28504.1 hypothetical protein EIK79_15535 [Halocatena pleomorpha]
MLLEFLVRLGLSVKDVFLNGPIDVGKDDIFMVLVLEIFEGIDIPLDVGCFDIVPRTVNFESLVVAVLRVDISLLFLRTRPRDHQ